MVLYESLFWITAFLECWMSNGGSQLSDPWFSHATQSGKVWVQWELWVSSRNSGYWKFNKTFTICPYNNFFPHENSIFSLYHYKLLKMYLDVQCMYHWWRLCDFVDFYWNQTSWGDRTETLTPFWRALWTESFQHSVQCR